MRATRSARRRIIRLCVAATISTALSIACIGLLLLGVGPMTGRYRVLTVQSGSMEPTMPIGSMVVLTPQPLSSIRVGDIITFQMPTDTRALETHRVVQILKPGDHPTVVTKGDANATPDPWRLTLTDGPAWRVRMVVPEIGSVLAWWRQSAVRNTALLALPALVAIIWLAEIWRPEQHRPRGTGRHRAVARPG